MGYGQLLKRAWQIARREKKLWVLGFMTHLGVLGIGALLLGSIGTEEQWELGAALTCLGLWIWIALWLVSACARGGLIAGVQQVEDGGSVGLRRAWRANRKQYRVLSGIGSATGLPLIVLGMWAVGGLFLLLMSFLVLGSAAPELSAEVSLVGLGCCGPVYCGGMVVALLMGVIQIYAERAAVLDGLGWREASDRGRQMVKANRGLSLVFLLINSLLEGIVLTLGVGALVLIDLAPFGLLRDIVLGYSHLEPWPWVAALNGVTLIAVVLVALIGSVERAFTSAMWTLAYREMIGREMS